MTSVTTLNAPHTSSHQAGSFNRRDSYQTLSAFEEPGCGLRVYAVCRAPALIPFLAPLA